MYSIKVHSKVNQITALFYIIGLWHRGDEPTVTETRIKCFYSFFYLLFPISLLGGAIKTDNKDDAIFLIETGIICIVLFVKFLYLIWKQKDILNLLHRIGDYSAADHKEFTSINDKLNIFMKIMNFFYLSALFFASLITFGVPIVSFERKLFFNIAFPFDWKNNETAYWAAVVFLFIEATLTAISLLFSILMWYLMINCSLKYKVLGNQLRNLGVIRTGNGVILEVGTQKLYQRDLIAGIKSQRDINE